ncbi:hypothetical protein AB3329_10820 [Streptococcus sp. H31]|uniref:hypothetical protein n=1 Tax=Streptococcus huangxiaojuni TaxID=3237239 RepID=UPI0034A3A99C
MALTDQDIQGIQKQVKPVSKDVSKEIGDTIKVNIVDSEGNITGTKSYEIVNKTNGTTEALAVAPVNNKETDYSQTAIVVART